MALRLSTALRNFITNFGSVKEAFDGGRLMIYSGSQPASPDDAPAGSLLCTISLASGALTAEVLPTGTVTLSGADGYVTAVNVSGVALLADSVAYSGSLTATALLVANAINANRTRPDYKAAAAGAVITIEGLPGIGTGANTFAISSAVSGGTLSKADSAMSGGVAQVNGLKFGYSDTGALAKGAGVWSGVNSASGTAGWFRLVSGIADTGAYSLTALRLDGNISTAGANLNLSTTTLVIGIPTTVDQFTLTMPAA